jgi:hypothetical protein
MMWFLPTAFMVCCVGIFFHACLLHLNVWPSLLAVSQRAGLFWREEGEKQNELAPKQSRFSSFSLHVPSTAGVFPPFCIAAEAPASRTRSTRHFVYGPN